MAHLTIRKFGPISQCDIAVKRFMALIGPQSSGKSTISKLIFYFYHVRDETVAHFLESLEGGRQRFDWKGYFTRLRKRFVEFWGPTPQDPDVEVQFDYGNGITLTIALEHRSKNNFYKLQFCPEGRKRIDELYETIRQSYESGPPRPRMFFSPEVIAAEKTRAELIESLRSACADIFNYGKELLFIPAGRSLLSTLSDQLQYVQPHLLDYPMRQFVDRVNASKAFFNKSIDDIIEERRLYWTGALPLNALRRARDIIQRVLRGEYRHDHDGGKLYIRSNVFTKINYASSGQQEAIWILLSLFLVILDHAQAMIFIEEPEAHLFPNAQRDVLELIAFVHNSLNCDCVITTHSPYVLSVINNFTYAHALGTKLEGIVSDIVPKDLWISSRNLGGYFVSNGGVESLIDSDVNMLRVELVDSASEKINEEYDALWQLEQEALTPGGEDA